MARRVIRALIWALTGGRPPVGRPESLVQYSRKRRRCHRRTVSGVARTSGSLHQAQTVQKPAGQKAAEATAPAEPDVSWHFPVTGLTKDNAPAVTLYRSAGFETFGLEPMAILTPGGFKSKNNMSRHLMPVYARQAFCELPRAFAGGRRTAGHPTGSHRWPTHKE